MNTSSRVLRILVAVLVFGCLDVSAAEPQATSPTPTLSKAQREQMASAHEHMAQCLRSDRTLSECRTEMQAACKTMGAQGCPAMGAGMGMHHQMMRPASEPTPPSSQK